MKNRVLLLPGGMADIGGTLVGNVHSTENCAGRPCVLHNPTQHHMTELPLLFRTDRGIVERVCEHGVGHPDPDQRGIAGWGSVHGCCHEGCCRP